MLWLEAIGSIVEVHDMWIRLRGLEKKGRKRRRRRKIRYKVTKEGSEKSVKDIERIHELDIMGRGI